MASGGLRSRHRISLLQHELPETSKRKAVHLTVMQNVEFGLRAQQSGGRSPSHTLRVHLNAAKLTGQGATTRRGLRAFLGHWTAAGGVGIGHRSRPGKKPGLNFAQPSLFLIGTLLRMILNIVAAMLVASSAACNGFSASQPRGAPRQPASN